MTLVIELNKVRYFGDEPKTHPLPLPRDFSAPFSTPKFSSPTYLLTPSLELGRAPELE